MFCERHEIERLECNQLELGARCQTRRVVEKGIQSATHVQESLGCVFPEMLGELGVETLARRIGNHHLHAGCGRAESRCGARGHRNFGAIGGSELSDPEFQPMQRVRADFVHGYLADFVQDGQADGADTRVELGDARTLGDLRAHMLDDVLGDV